MRLSDGVRAARATTMAAVLLVAIAGCPVAPGPVGGYCPDDLGVRYQPREATLRVGETFTPKVEYLGCRGTKVLDTQIVYATSDAAILEVDPASGFTRARSVGEATLVAESREFGFPVRIPVTVIAAAP